LPSHHAAALFSAGESGVIDAFCAGRHLSDIVATLLSRPDEVMLEVGAGGELLVARLRVVIAAMLLLLPLANAMTGGQMNETLIGLAGAVFVNLFAQVWLALARQKRRYRWLPFASAAFGRQRHDPGAVHARRQPPAGRPQQHDRGGAVPARDRVDGPAQRRPGDGPRRLLAIAQYALLTAVVFSIASPDQLISSDYGTVSLGGQLQRMVLLLAFTMIIAVVVYRMQRLVEMSGTDGLTGLPNRTWLVHRFPRLLDRARRDGVSLCVALIDLDHFKRINDEIGHHAGDRALMHVVDLARDSLEDGEWLARLGGEEFVLVLRKPLGTAWERVDGLRRTLFARRFVPDQGADPLVAHLQRGRREFSARGQRSVRPAPPRRPAPQHGQGLRPQSRARPRYLNALAASRGAVAAMHTLH
jgi:diguanylate cyclase (GGDEF)-like protein